MDLLLFFIYCSQVIIIVLIIGILKLLVDVFYDNDDGNDSY